MSWLVGLLRRIGLRAANLNGVHLAAAVLTDAPFAGAIANQVTRQRAQDADDAFGAPDVWTRPGTGPVGTWRVNGLETCLDAYSR
ncbi:MAG TPA: hypothetical protein VIL48_03780 [Acidimicrobiales bacterium]